MGSRGFTLLELLIGLFAGSIVLGGIASLFLYAHRVGYTSESQMFLQRQGALVMDQMTQRILSAGQPPGTTAPPLTRGVCRNFDTNSIGVTNTNYPPPPNNGSPYCFYRLGNQLRMDTATGTWNLLSGTTATLTVTSFTTTLNDPRVTISFQLTDNRLNSMTFTTDLTRRN
jgi:prepilin-type N-terminal cleavage/methylation domain-containing protein